MPRKPNPFSRPYKLTPEAIEQRKKALADRWASLEGESRSLPGRPRKKRRHSLRGTNGRFIAAVAQS